MSLAKTRRDVDLKIRLPSETVRTVGVLNIVIIVNLSQYLRRHTHAEHRWEWQQPHRRSVCDSRTQRAGDGTTDGSQTGLGVKKSWAATAVNNTHSSTASSFSAHRNLAAYGRSISSGQTWGVKVGGVQRAAIVIYFTLGLAALCRCLTLSVRSIALHRPYTLTVSHSSSSAFRFTAVLWDNGGKPLQSI